MKIFGHDVVPILQTHSPGTGYFCWGSWYINIVMEQWGSSLLQQGPTVRLFIEPVHILTSVLAIYLHIIFPSEW